MPDEVVRVIVGLFLLVKDEHQHSEDQESNGHKGSSDYKRLVTVSVCLSRSVFTLLGTIDGVHGIKELLFVHVVERCHIEGL